MANQTYILSEEPLGRIEIVRSVGETQPLDVILEAFGEFIDLSTGSAAVTFSMIDERYWQGQQDAVSATLEVDTAACTLPNSSGADGLVRWSPVAGDVDTGGRYTAQYTVTQSSKVRKFPKDPRDLILILQPSLDDLA